MLGELAILGALASVLVQWIKQAGKSKLFTLVVLVVVSFVISIFVWLLQEYNLWQWFLGIMAAASLVYAFLLQHIEGGLENFLNDLEEGIENDR